MKKIEQNRLNELLKIINIYPEIRIAHFSDGGDELIQYINDFCMKNNYEYQVNCTDPDFYEHLSPKYEDRDKTRILNFNIARPSYIMQGKKYDYVFLSNTTDDDFRGTFLKRVHAIIKNAGNIIIFTLKGGYIERDKWIAELEEQYYVSSSIISDMFENYDVIVSRKMHGWGK
ncbi:hypothetical protein MNB_SV-5-105 [hydrothermal vent metagenome]|uniref:Uncharacterized protein n=1 Tax=hydrothermal vent metagenome TaxID=652676 RepID=A0A1W1EFN3_9ZZZZ